MMARVVRTILLTGYGPYGREGANPTEAVARSLDGRRIGGARIPAELSNTAGTYLCNFAMYTALDVLADVRPLVPAGFNHVPQTPEANVGRPGQPSMALETSREASRIALEEIASAPPTRRQPPRRSSPRR